VEEGGRRLSHSEYRRGAEPDALDRSDADGLPAASSVMVLETESKNVREAVSFPQVFSPWRKASAKMRSCIA